MKPTAFLRRFLAIAGSAVLAAPLVNATTITWDPAGGGASDGAGAWLTAGDWWDGAASVNWTSGDDAIFGNGGAGGAVTLASPTVVNSLTLNSFTGTYTLGTASQTITLNNGITMNSGAGAATIISPITLGAAQSWTNNDNSLLTIGTGAVTNAGYLLTIDGTGNTTVSSAIGGAGGLTKSGSGILTLSGSNGFTGQLTVANGTLSIGSINNVSAAGTLGNSDINVPVILGSSGNTGTLKYTAASGSSDKAFTLAAGGTGAFDITTALTLSGPIAGSGNLTKTGAGVLTISNSLSNYGAGVANQFTGVTTITNGKIKLNAIATGFVPANSAIGLQKSVYDTTGSTGAIGLDVTGVNTLWLGGLAGSVNLATAITGYSTVSSLYLSPQTGTTATYDGIIANGPATTALTKLGPGTQTLTGINSYSGATNIYAGTLALSGATGSALNSAFTVRGGTLELDNSGGTFISRIADVGAASALSLGSLTLKSYNGAGAQTETVGATTFANGGKVTINNGANVGDRTTLALGAVTRSAGAAIDFVGTNGTLGGAGDTPNVTSTGAFPNISNGILGWATVGGTQWAENNAGSIRAYSGTFDNPTSDPTNAARNSQLTGSGTLASAKSFNSLNVISSGAGQSFNLNSGANLTLNTQGGILKSGTDAYTISSGGGNITAGAELITHVDGGALTISAPLNTAILGIAKGGTGNLILSGTRAGTLSGAIGIGGGNLEFQGLTTNITGLVTGPGGLIVNLNAGQMLSLNNTNNTFSGPILVKGGVFSVGGAYNTQGVPNVNPGGGAVNVGGLGNIELNGGILAFPYTFNRTLGADSDQFQITGGVSGLSGTNTGGGFAINGTINYEVVWGASGEGAATGYFNPTTFVLQAVTNAAGILTFGNKLDLNGATRTIAVDAASAANGAAISGVIRTSSGTAGLTKTGIGTLTLSGANAFNGAITVNQGTLSFQGNANVASANPLGQSSAAAANLLLANGTTLLYNGAAASTDRSFTINGTADGHGASLNASGSAAINFSNTATPAYGTVDQTRILTLTGTNTNNNTLAANIADNGTGAVSVTKTGAGLWVLSGTTSSYTGPTTISAGTLSVSAVNNLGGATSNLVFNGGTLQVTGGTLTDFSDLGRTVVFNSGQTVGLDIPGTFTADQTLNQGLGGLTKSGAGTLVINSAHTYTGLTTISAGTLRLDSGGVIASPIIGNNAAFVTNSAGAVTQGSHFGIIGGTGTVTQSGAGTLTLSLANTFTGATTVSAGTIAITNAKALQNSAYNTTGSNGSTIGLDVTNGLTSGNLTLGGLAGSVDLASAFSAGFTGTVTNLTLNPQSGITSTYGGVIANTTMSLTKTGAGTQIFQGANLYEGATFLNAGTLELSGSGSILNSAITFNNGGLTLTNTAAETGSGRIHDTTSITSNGGTLTYNNTSGANVYSETVGSVALTRGQLNIVQAVNQAGAGSQTLTLAGLTQSGTSAVTFSSAGTRTTKNMIVVTGATATAANEIIAPWATIGTTAALQTDYAIYNGSAQVVDRNIAASNQSTWSTTASATSNYTKGGAGTLGAVTLDATRNINSLRATNTATAVTVNDFGNVINLNAHGFANGDPVVFTGTTAPGPLTYGTVYYARNVTANTFELSTTPGGGLIDLANAGTSSAVIPAMNLGNFNLGTNGILNGGTGTLAIGRSTGATGVITLPTTTAGNLYVTAGAGNIIIATPINDNTGALTLVKGGSGSLTLSGTSNYSGGTVINGGSLTYTADTNLGQAGTRNLTFAGSATLNTFTGSSLGALTVNTGATASISNNTITFASTTGSGAINFLSANGSTSILTLGNASAFQGALTINIGGNGKRIDFNSLGDAVGAGNLRFAGQDGDSGQRGIIRLMGDTGALTLNNRQIEFGGPGSNWGFAFANLENTNATAANKFVINTNLLNLHDRNHTFQLGGSNIGDNEFAGTIGDSTRGTYYNAPGTLSLIKADAGRWILSGANTYTGATTVSGGTLQISSLANGGEVSNIGTSSSAAGSLILNGGTLRYTGAAVSTDRLFSLQVSSTIDASGTGAVNFTNIGTMGFNGGTAAKTLTLTGANTDNNTIAAVIGDLTAATTVVKNGIGTWVLGGNTNSYTGTTTLNTGRLVLDYAASNTTKLANGAVLTLGGGTLELSGGSHTEIVASTTLTANTGTRITQTNSGASVLQMGTITRNNHATLSFSANNIATTSSANTNGILGPWATVGSHWAVNSTNGANGLIVALSSYTALPTTGGTGTVNYQLSGGQTQTGDVTTNTVRLVNSANSDTLALGTRALNLGAGTGGLIYAGGFDDNFTITGTTGAIKSQTPNNQIVLNVYTGTLTVNALLNTGSAVTAKFGDGTLVVGGNNTSSGAFYQHGGVVRLTHNNAMGTTAGGVVVQNGAALELANSVAIGAEALTISGYGIANAGALRNVAGNTSSYAGAITLNTATSVGGARINSDAGGLLTLTGGVVTSLYNDVTFGGAGNTTVSTVAISGAGGLTQDGAGTTTLTATNTYTGATTVAAGVLSVNGSLASASSVTVQSGGTLQGSGTIGGSVTIQTGGTLASGNSIESLATGALSLEALSTFAYEMDRDAAANVSGDLTAVTGNLTIALTNDANLSLFELGAGTWEVGEKLTLISYTGTWNGGLLKILGGSVINDDSTITYSNVNWLFNYNDTAEGDNYTADSNGTYVTMTAMAVIPEPGAALIGSLGLLALLRRRRN